MTAHPEHDLQVKINQWCREHVPQPHFFFAVDRRQKSARMSHVREKARGHVSGTPDTVLLLPTFPAITIELKAKDKKPEPGGDQEKVGAVIQTSGHLWGWCDSVAGYCALLRRFGVVLGPYAAVKAEHHDLVLAGAAIKREEAKTGVPSKKRTYKPRSAKPSAGRIRKVEGLRRNGMLRF
jgi:hypothetical protein